MSERGVFRFMIVSALIAAGITRFMRFVSPDTMPEPVAVLVLMFWGTIIIATLLSAMLIVAINAAKLMGLWHDAD